MPDFFITGTDTAVGKTYAVCALLRDLRRRGLHAVGYKPVACGDGGEPRAMRDAAGESGTSLEEINPVYLKAAAAPLIAAELEQRVIDPDELTEQYRQLCTRFCPVLAEGAGGWETPLSPGVSTADLAVALGLPVILVVGNKLGAVNHAVLTVQAIRARGLVCHGVVLNHVGEEWSAAEVTNRRLIEEITGVSVVAELIHGQQNIDSAAVLGV